MDGCARHLVFKLDSRSSNHLVNDADVFSTLNKPRHHQGGGTLEARKKCIIEGNRNRDVPMKINVVIYIVHIGLER